MNSASSSPSLKLTGDKARRSLDDGDEFGLADFIKALASTLTERITTEGYVIGIEGEWGSGKSSFVNYVVDEILKRETQHEIIRFEPWLVGNRDRLLIHFFELLASRVEKLAAADHSFWPPWKWRATHAKNFLNDLGKKVRKYGNYPEHFSFSILVSNDQTKRIL